MVFEYCQAFQPAASRGWVEAVIPDEASAGLRIEVTTQPTSCITGIRRAPGASETWEEAAIVRGSWG